MWRFQVHDTITGGMLQEVFPSGGSWTRRLNGQGSGSHTFQLHDEETALPRHWSRELFRPNARTLVVCWNFQPIYAGLIQSTSYSRDTGELTVQHSEIRALFKARLTFGVNVYPQGDLTITNRSPRGAVRAILQRATEWSSWWDLPLVLPPDEAGGISKDWKNYQALTIEDCLAEIEAAGFEIDFRPEFADGSLRWGVYVNTLLAAGDVELSISAEDTPITGFTEQVDGSRQLTGVFLGGNGTEADMATAYAGMTATPSIPVRDAYRSEKDVRDLSELQAIADSMLAQWRDPVRQYSFKVALEDVNPQHLVPCRRIHLPVWDDPWLPDGTSRWRSIALAGDMSLSVTPEVEFIGG